MNIDWMALLIVAGVSVATSVVFTTLLAGGIRFVVSAKASAASGRGGTAALSLGYTLLALAGLLVLFGIYLIVPQFG